MGYPVPMEPASLGVWAKLIDAAKNWPLWIFFAISASLTALVAVPYFQSLVSPAGGRWLDFLTLAAWIFTVALAAAHLIRLGHAHSVGAEARIKFVISPIEHQCVWGVSKQADGTFITNISTHFLVTNRMSEPLYLMAARVIKPRMAGERLPGIVTIQAVDNRMHGTAHVSGHFVPSGRTLPVSATILIRGTPRQKEGTMTAVVELADANAHKARVKLTLSCIMPHT